MHERAHGEVPADKFFREVRSNKSGRAGYQYFSQRSRPRYAVILPKHPAMARSLLNRTAGRNQFECGNKHSPRGIFRPTGLPSCQENPG
jgi:hypothetical protein